MTVTSSWESLILWLVGCDFESHAGFNPMSLGNSSFTLEPNLPIIICEVKSINITFKIKIMHMWESQYFYLRLFVGEAGWFPSLPASLQLHIWFFLIDVHCSFDVQLQSSDSENKKVVSTHSLKKDWSWRLCGLSEDANPLFSKNLLQQEASPRLETLSYPPFFLRLISRLHWGLRSPCMSKAWERYSPVTWVPHKCW